MRLTPDLKDVGVFVHTCTQSPKPWLPSQPTPCEVSTALNSQASLRCSYSATQAVPYQSSNPVPAPHAAHTPCLQCAPSKTTMTPPRSETECAPQQKWAASSGGVSLDCQPRKMVIVLSPCQHVWDSLGTDHTTTSCRGHRPGSMRSPMNHTEVPGVGAQATGTQGH